MSTVILRDTIFEYRGEYVLHIDSFNIKNIHKAKIDKLIVIRTIVFSCPDVSFNKNKISQNEYQHIYKNIFKNAVKLFFKNSNLSTKQIYDIVESVNRDGNLTVYELKNDGTDVRNLKLLPHYSYERKMLYNNIKDEHI